MFLAEMADALRLERVDVAACSMGGTWAIALADARPELVRHLVLVGAPAGSRRAMIPLKIGVLAWPIVGSLVGAMIGRGAPEGTRSFWRVETKGTQPARSVDLRRAPSETNS